MAPRRWQHPSFLLHIILHAAAGLLLFLASSTESFSPTAPIQSSYLNRRRNLSDYKLPRRTAHRANIRPSRLASSSSSDPTSSTSSTTTTTTAASSLGAPLCQYHQVTIPTSQQGQLPRQDVSVEDLTPTLLKLLQASGMTQGTVTVISRHTTTAITINERESRLAQDMADFFLNVAPPDERSESSNKRSSSSSSKDTRYRHNDIDQRPDSDEEAQRCRENGWDIDDPKILQEWRDQEPINAHSHLLSMLLGSSESIPVVDGSMVLGQWQSVLLVDLDGPRDRTVGIQLNGYST
jgi:thiamine phosphate synthase YjbQ (UPF0047 family)